MPLVFERNDLETMAAAYSQRRSALGPSVIERVGRSYIDLLRPRMKAKTGVTAASVMVRSSGTDPEGFYADVGPNPTNEHAMAVAYWNEVGTGIYGPKGSMIRPVRAKAMVWVGDKEYTGVYVNAEDLGGGLYKMVAYQIRGQTPSYAFRETSNDPAFLALFRQEIVSMYEEIFRP